MADWAVGVITSRRAQPTIRTCLEHLLAAGWADAHVFCEPGSEAALPGWHSLWSNRGRQLGCWANFYLSAWELLLTHPRADYFLLLEDDAKMYCGVAPSTREYLTTLCQLVLHDHAALSLYASGSFVCTDPMLHSVHQGWCFSGAVALVLGREALRHFLTDSRVAGHRFDNDDWHGTRLNDSVLGRWALEDYKKPIGIHAPTLVQHVGDISTIDNPAGRRASFYIGDLADPAAAWQRVVARMTPNLRAHDGQESAGQEARSEARQEG